MNLSTVALQGSQPLATRERYAKDLAQEAAQFADDPEATAARYLTEVCDIGSLKTEGYCSENPSALYMSRRSQFNPEAVAVLKDVATKVAQESGAPAGEFQFQPSVLTGDMLIGNAVRRDQSGSVSQVYQIALHDTPGIDGGLMLVTPLQGPELDYSKSRIERDVKCRLSVNLGQPEAGWHVAR